MTDTFSGDAHAAGHDAPVAAYIGKCKVKGCRTALRVDDVTESCRSTLSRLEYVAEARDAATPGVGYCIGNYGPYARCAEHGLFPLRTLRGRYDAARECDARCMNATGPSCDCQCGGANHGHAHV